MFKLLGFLLLAVSFSVQAADISYWVQDLKVIFLEIEKKHPESLKLDDAPSLVLNLNLIKSAYASSDQDCIYGGWPSQKIKVGEKFLCRSPVLTKNYQNGPCSQNELQCQPLLFGPGMCVGFKSKQEKLNATQACENKFNQSKRNYQFVKKFDSHDKQQLLNLSYLAGNLCSKFKSQSCEALKTKLPKVLNQLEERSVSPNQKKSSSVQKENLLCEEPQKDFPKSIMSIATTNLDQTYEALKKDFLASPHCQPELVLGNPKERPDPILMQNAMQEISEIMSANKMGFGIEELMDKYALSNTEKTEIKAWLVPYPKKYNDKIRNVTINEDMRFWENNLDYRKNRNLAEIKLIQGIIKSLEKNSQSSQAEIADGLMNNGIFNIDEDDKPVCPFVTKDAFMKAMAGLEAIKKKGSPVLKNKNQLTIVDYTQPSNQRRMYVFDLEKMQVLHNTWTAHGGKASGSDGWGSNPEFSNEIGSGKSSEGFILAKSASYGSRFGDNVILQGLDQNNFNLQSRAVVLHGWNTPLSTYSPDMIKEIKQVKDGTWLELGQIKSTLRSGLTYQKYMSPTEGCLGITTSNVSHLDRKKRTPSEMKALEEKGHSQVEYLRQDLPGTIIFNYSGEDQKSKFF
jgi:hypothetical protein